MTSLKIVIIRAGDGQCVIRINCGSGELFLDYVDVDVVSRPRLIAVEEISLARRPLLRAACRQKKVFALPLKTMRR